MQRRIGVLLGLDHPGDEVGQPDDAVDFEPVRGLHRVEVREVEEHEAAQADYDQAREEAGGKSPDTC